MYSYYVIVAVFDIKGGIQSCYFSSKFNV